MIDGILLSLCIAVAIFSRKLYCDSERERDECTRAFAITLDMTSLAVALAVLVDYWNIIP